MTASGASRSGDRSRGHLGSFSDRARAAAEAYSEWGDGGRRGVASEGAVLALPGGESHQVRSRDRVRDLAEVFTHRREVDAILDLVPEEMFAALDAKFLEPACGSGNFLVEILRRKLRVVARADFLSQDEYEHRLLRVIASIYGVDISEENITEARARMGHLVLASYGVGESLGEPSAGFLSAAALILDANVVCGDSLIAADRIELCDWRPHPDGCFQRVWSHALVPPHERNLFWMERVQDPDPRHFSALGDGPTVALAASRVAPR